MNASLKIALLSQWYTPEPVPFPHDIAGELRRRGHRVNVITGFPNYPTGRVYPGYRQRLRQVEYRDGVRVTRRPLFPSHDESPWRRATNYLTFAASAARAVSVLNGADVIFVYATPLTAALPALVAHRRHGVPYVLQVQDLWPDSVTSSQMMPPGLLSQVVERRIHRIASSSYRNAAAIIGISEAMTEELVRRGAHRPTTHTVHNWSPQEAPALTHTVHNWSPQEAPALAPAPSEQGVTRFVYAGNLGRMQDLETLVRATRIAEQHCNLDVLLIGDGVIAERLRALTRSLQVKSMRFTKRVPPKEMDAHYAAADFSLVTLLDREVFAWTVPSKFQASLARGVPVVTSVRGEVAAICKRHGCGFTALPQDPQSLAGAMRRAASLTQEERSVMRSRARRTYESLFLREQAIARIESILTASAKGDIA